MKDKMERFALLPFSMGCVSESSVAVGGDQPKPSRTRPPSTKRGEEEEKEESSSSIAESMKSSSLKFPKPSISKLLKSFKSFTQLFGTAFAMAISLSVYKEEMEDELEMEIGYPTDVKHVTHIGLDGSTSTNPTQGWDRLVAPPRHRHLLSGLDDAGDDPLKQFELSMAAAQASFVPSHHI